MSIIADFAKTFGFPGGVGLFVGFAVATFIAPNTWQGFVVLVALTALIVILVVTVVTWLYRITRRSMSPTADVPSSPTGSHLPTTPRTDSVDQTRTNDGSETPTWRGRREDDQR